jgi:hypothetical protein
MSIKFTQTMMMHLNGGRTYSILQYKILADGKPTDIQRVQRTSGSPKYLIEVDTFTYRSCLTDEAQFDNFAAKGKGLKEWLEAHV